MRCLASALLGAASVLAAGPLFAQATPEGAAALQKGLTAILTPTLATAGLGEPIFEGGWTVEPAGADYRITGPALSLVLRDDVDGRKRVVRIRCDGDRYTAVAGEGTAYRLRGDTPPRCEIRPSGGEPPVTVTSRARSAELTLDLAASLLTASTDRSDGVTVTKGGETLLAIDRLRLTSATTPRPGSPRQDIDMQVEVEGISAGDPAAGDDVTLGRLRYGGRLEDVDVAALRDRVWRLIAFALDAARRDPKAPSPPNGDRKLDTLMRQALALAGETSRSELVLTDLRGGGGDTTAGFDSLTVAGGYRGFDRAAPGRGLGGDVTLDLRGLEVADVSGGTVEEPGALTIDRVRLSGTLDPVAGAPTAGAALALDFDGVSFALTENGGETPTETHFDLAKARYRVSADGIDVAGLIDVIGGFEAMLAKHGDQDPPQEELSPWLGRLRTTIAALSRYETEISLSDLRMRSPEANLTLAGISYGETYSGLDGDEAGYGLRLALDDLALDPSLPFAGWVPRQARIDIALKDVPSRSIQALFWDGIERAIQADALQGDDPLQSGGDLVFAETLQQISARLLSSGVSLSIGSFRISAPKGAIDLGGGGAVDAKAAFGVTAQAKLQVAGLDEFVKFLQSQAEAEAAAGFTVFQMLGREAKTAEGQAARDYDLVVDPQGRMLINGTDLTTLMPK
ncbi:hypothetical protein [Inquilinus limosus]|uniref:hypothetical protein n=1 Tax=Inquilinus limosus TaxID=171674 RepID=UPI00040EEBA7|nr:hypothetical protein [Inquilinus limosus]